MEATLPSWTQTVDSGHEQHGYTVEARPARVRRSALGYTCAHGPPRARQTALALSAGWRPLSSVFWSQCRSWSLSVSSSVVILMLIIDGGASGTWRSAKGVKGRVDKLVEIHIQNFTCGCRGNRVENGVTGGGRRRRRADIPGERSMFRPRRGASRAR